MLSALVRTGRIVAIIAVLMLSAGLCILSHALPACAEMNWVVTNTSDSATDPGSLRYAMTSSVREWRHNHIRCLWYHRSFRATADYKHNTILRMSGFPS